MQITRKNRSATRRICHLLNRYKVDRLAQRADLKKKLAELQESGKVAIVYGGIECDGGRWDNRVSLVPTTITAVEQWAEHGRVAWNGWRTPSAYPIPSV